MVECGCSRLLPALLQLFLLRLTCLPVPCVVGLADGPATNPCSFIQHSCQSLPSFACRLAGRAFVFPVNLDHVTPHSPLAARPPKQSTISIHSGWDVGVWGGTSGN